eukprot:scaffold19698_cov59-Phaeocystis_antarctica.AAC.6
MAGGAQELCVCGAPAPGAMQGKRARRTSEAHIRRTHHVGLDGGVQKVPAVGVLVVVDQHVVKNLHAGGQA